jgi:hypothetical protein
MTMPPSKDAPAAIVCAALRTDVPEEAGKLPPEELEEFEEPPVVAGFEVAVAEADLALVEEALTDVALVFEANAETVLLVEFDTAASTTKSRSQSRSEIDGAAVTARAKLRTVAT